MPRCSQQTPACQYLLTRIRISETFAGILFPIRSAHSTCSLEINPPNGRWTSPLYRLLLKQKPFRIEAISPESLLDFILRDTSATITVLEPNFTSLSLRTIFSVQTVSTM